MSSISKAGFAALIFAVDFFFFAASGAKADITFCNKFGRLVYVAIAYPQSDGSFISRGWMSLSDGNCAQFDTAIHVKTFYFRGESEWYREGGHRSREIWGKGDKFAIWENDNFQYYDAQQQVLNSTLVEFTHGPEAENGDVSTTVTFTDHGSTMTLN
ncbi:MAG TPA: DUF1036 domain-containing protein [Methylovirgula sp.]|nr:DUF1036 domain-containing protein [Methylovirgula sp.]